MIMIYWLLELQIKSHISKGVLSMEEYLQKLHQIKDILQAYNAHFDEVYCCPHTT